MKTIVSFLLCLLACVNAAKPSFTSDAIDILRHLNLTLKTMDQLSTCYDSVYEQNRTVEEKQRCMALLASLRQPIESSRRTKLRNQVRNRLRNRRPIGSSRRPCTRFNRSFC